MKFYLTPYTSNHCDGYEGEKQYPHIEIVTDAWDDYYQYETLFRAHYRKSEKEIKYIGQLKIMKKGTLITRNHMPTEFERLSGDFCSLGQDIEYYRTLKNTFTKRVVQEILEALNDAAIHSEIYDKFKSCGGFNDSLLRFSEAYKALSEGRSIIEGIDYENIFKFKYMYKFDESNQEYEIDFDFEKSEFLPHRINILVGKNGVGKTNLLTNLSSNLSGIKRNKGEIEAEGRPKFSKYIVISYNPFDDFNKPYEIEPTLKEYEKLYNDLSGLENSLKVVKDNTEIDADDKDFLDTEVENIDALIEGLKLGLGEKYKIIKRKVKDNQIDTNMLFSYVYCGLRTRKGLITLDEMKENFKKSIDKIKGKQLLEEWIDILAEVIEDRTILDNILTKVENGDMDSLFQKLSSGQSILICVVSSIIEHIEEESLIIFDEPEVHLHPNAICSFMKMFNKLLIKFDSYAIVATHSPLIIQEVPSKYIRLLNRQLNGRTEVQTIEEECFGENISNITNYIFDITECESNYKSYFKYMVQEIGLDKETILKMFKNNLSYNALLYLNFLFKKKE